MCAMLLPNMPKFPLYELSCLIFFLVPMLSIAMLYVRMGLRIQSNGLGHSIEGSVHGETRQAQSRKAIIRKCSVNFRLFRNITISFVTEKHTHTHTTTHHPHPQTYTCRTLRVPSNLSHRALMSCFILITFLLHLPPSRLPGIISRFINHM